MRVRNHPKLLLSFVLFIALFGVACTIHGRIYNLTTGEVTPVAITYGGSGRGKISGVIPSSGEKVSGEYMTSTSAYVPAGWGKVYARVYGGGPLLLLRAG